MTAQNGFSPPLLENEDVFKSTPTSPAFDNVASASKQPENTTGLGKILNAKLNSLRSAVTDNSSPLKVLQEHRKTRTSKPKSTGSPSEQLHKQIEHERKSRIDNLIDLKNIYKVNKNEKFRIDTGPHSTLTEEEKDELLLLGEFEFQPPLDSEIDQLNVSIQELELKNLFAQLDITMSQANPGQNNFVLVHNQDVKYPVGLLNFDGMQGKDTNSLWLIEFTQFASVSGIPIANILAQLNKCFTKDKDAATWWFAKKDRVTTLEQFKNLFSSKFNLEKDDHTDPVQKLKSYKQSNEQSFDKFVEFILTKSKLVRPALEDKQIIEILYHSMLYKYRKDVKEKLSTIDTVEQLEQLCKPIDMAEVHTYCDKEGLSPSVIDNIEKMHSHMKEQGIIKAGFKPKQLQFNNLQTEQEGDGQYEYYEEYPEQPPTQPRRRQVQTNRGRGQPRGTPAARGPPRVNRGQPRVNPPMQAAVADQAPVELPPVPANTWYGYNVDPANQTTWPPPVTDRAQRTYGSCVGENCGWPNMLIRNCPRCRGNGMYDPNYRPPQQPPQQGYNQSYQGYRGYNRNYRGQQYGFRGNPYGNPRGPARYRANYRGGRQSNPNPNPQQEQAAAMDWDESSDPNQGNY
jgi:hypothetical protein